MRHGPAPGGKSHSRARTCGGADPNEVVEGKQSLTGRYQGASEYNKILFTDSGVLYLEPGKTYTVSFKYRILETPDKGFEVLFYSGKGAAADDWLPAEVFTGSGRQR